MIQLWPESQRDAGDEDAAAVEEVEEGDGDVVAAVDDVVNAAVAVVTNHSVETNNRQAERV